jgi:hypothetical protein
MRSEHTFAMETPGLRRLSIRCGAGAEGGRMDVQAVEAAIAQQVEELRKQGQCPSAVELGTSAYDALSTRWGKNINQVSVPRDECPVAVNLTYGEKPQPAWIGPIDLDIKRGDYPPEHIRVTA